MWTLQAPCAPASTATHQGCAPRHIRGPVAPAQLCTLWCLPPSSCCSSSRRQHTGSSFSRASGHHAGSNSTQTHIGSSSRGPSALVASPHSWACTDVSAACCTMRAAAAAMGPRMPTSYGSSSNQTCRSAAPCLTAPRGAGHSRQVAAAAQAAAAGAGDNRGSTNGRPPGLPAGDAYSDTLKIMGSQSWYSQVPGLVSGLLSQLGAFLAACWQLLPQFQGPKLSEALQRMGLVLGVSLVMIVVLCTIDSLWLFCYLLRARRLAV